METVIRSPQKGTISKVVHQKGVGHATLLFFLSLCFCFYPPPRHCSRLLVGHLTDGDTLVIGGLDLGPLVWRQVGPGSLEFGRLGEL